MRISVRTVMLWLGAFGAVAAAAATWYLDEVQSSATFAKHHHHKGAALTVIAVVAITGAAYRPLYALTAGRLIARRDRVRTAMRGLIWIVYDLCDGTGGTLPIREIGASAWLVVGLGPHRWLHRLARERFQEYPQASGIRWTKGKGIVGRCWKDEREHVIQTEKIDEAHSNDSESDWNRVRSDTRMSLSHAEFRKLSGKYGTVIAVPIKDSAEHVIGVVTLDGPPGYHAMLSAKPVVTEVTKASALVAQLLGRA